MEKHIDKETLIKYLNFEISYEDADFDIDDDAYDVLLNVYYVL